MFWSVVKRVSMAKHSCYHNLLRLLIARVPTTSKVMQMRKTPLHPTSDYALHAPNAKRRWLLIDMTGALLDLPSGTSLHRGADAR